MLEHFEIQLKSAHILTSDNISGFVGDDVESDCGTEDELTEFYTTKIGQKILFYLLWSDIKSKYQLFRVFEKDIESELKGKAFVDMSAATPLFR